jgi:hypothetical protein
MGNRKPETDSTRQRVGRKGTVSVRSLNTDERSLRSDFFVTMVLADAHLAAGELEQACGAALTALSEGEEIRSARCVSYVREFRERLTMAGNSRHHAAAVRINGSELGSGATGIRTPDLLHACKYRLADIGPVLGRFLPGWCLAAPGDSLHA